MTFRERARKLFKSSSRPDSLSKSDTTSSDTERWPSNVYKPGETMPRPKYRAVPKKEHTEKLESFSFADAWRRRSFQSTYSPMGTRAPSRRNSLFSRKSVSGRSLRTASIASDAGTEKTGPHRMETQAEVEGDDDVTNVGISRVQSREHNPVSRPRTATDEDDEQPNGLCKTGTAHDHNPFTEADLALAMKQSHLQVPPSKA